jgi:hypothetical protein
MDFGKLSQNEKLALYGAIATIVGELRGEEPPPERFDPRVHGVREIGNPHDKRKKRGER